VTGLFRSLRRGLPRGVTGDVGAPPSPIDGQWTHSDQPAIDAIKGDLFPGTSADVHNPESSEAGLAAIAAHDPGFSREVFLEQVQAVFFVVEGAWTQRKPDVSRQVMADGLWQQHRVQIQGCLDAHKRNILGDLSVASLTVVVAHSDASYDTITVRVQAACTDYDVDDASGKIIRGDQKVQRWTEDWTFQRSSTAKTPPGGGTLSSKCPNCGAPLDLDISGECKYCKALVSSGNFDWVLARISQVPAVDY